ncbi:MAG: hypothetical protein E5V90_13290, partial [Mesorhizobium sp.]
GRLRRVPSRPPLACRPSPPLGGRLAAVAPNSIPQRWRLAKAGATFDLPLVGEMSGRTEEGAVPPASEGNVTLLGAPSHWRGRSPPLCRWPASSSPRR